LVLEKFKKMLSAVGYKSKRPFCLFLPLFPRAPHDHDEAEDDRTLALKIFETHALCLPTSRPVAY
jgi:hypothetical protein